MAGDLVSVHLTGGSPWGFRLYGGEGDPLIVAKLRKRSKAVEQGLYEGDTILGVNGFSTHGISHAVAMSLIDQTRGTLELVVLRGANHNAAVSAAFEKCGPDLRPLPASLLPSAHAPPPLSPAQSMSSLSSPLAAHAQMRGGEPARYGLAAQAQAESLMNRQIAMDDDFGTARVSSMKHQFEVKIEEERARSISPKARDVNISRLSPRSLKENIAPLPSRQAPTPQPQMLQPAPRFNVKDFRSYNAEVQRRGPTSPPPPADDPVPQRWEPRFTTPRPVRRQQSPPPQTAQQPPQPQHPQHQPAYDPYSHHRGQEFDPNYQEPPPDEVQEVNMEHFRRSHDLEERDKAMFLNKVLTIGPDDNHTEQQGGGFLQVKKPVYADSSFYTDPEKKFPTIEEQIKMARKMAQSLIAPQNKLTRGSKMFQNRVRKADRWATAEEEYKYGRNPASDVEITSDSEEMYYRPNPWEVRQKWEPPKPMKPMRTNMAPRYQWRDEREPTDWTPPVNHSLNTPQPKFEAPPPRPTVDKWAPAQSSGAKYESPSVPSRLSANQESYMNWQVPAATQQPPPALSPKKWEPMSPGPARSESVGPRAAPPGGVPALGAASFGSAGFTSERNTDSPSRLVNVPRNMTAEQFEHYRLFEQKTKHDQLNPKLAFSIADDLRKMKGKGGNMFAKRRARSDKHVTDESTVPRGPSHPEIIRKLHGEEPMENGLPDSPRPVPRAQRPPAPPAAPPLPAVPPAPPGGPPEPKGPPPNRLTGLIEAENLRSEFSPWQAAMRSNEGRCDAAFHHLSASRMQQQKQAMIDNVYSSKTSSFVPQNVQPVKIGGQPTPTPLHQGGWQPVGAGKDRKWEKVSAAGTPVPVIGTPANRAASVTSVRSAPPAPPNNASPGGYKAPNMRGSLASINATPGRTRSAMSPAPWNSPATTHKQPVYKPVSAPTTAAAPFSAPTPAKAPPSAAAPQLSAQELPTNQLSLHAAESTLGDLALPSISSEGYSDL